MEQKTRIVHRLNRGIKGGWAVVLLLALLVTPAHAGYLNLGLGSEDFSFFPIPTAWDPGPNTARIDGFPAPGGATWSIMPAGLGLAVGTLPPSHPGGATSSAVDALITPAGDMVEETIIGDALDVWAAVSGFTNLGKVADGGVAGGADEAAGGALGDIRIGAYPFVGTGVLAHSWQPGNESLCDPPTGCSILGDIHINPAITWVDDREDTTAELDFDFFTVMLHELGHSLGLGHSGDSGSVMWPLYEGARRELTADDIAGIQAIYTPIPPSILLFASGLAGLAFLRRVSRV